MNFELRRDLSHSSRFCLLCMFLFAVKQETDTIELFYFPFIRRIGVVCSLSYFGKDSLKTTTAFSRPGLSILVNARGEYF